MSLFTSARERRLWLWTVVVLIAIYATLGPARDLAAALRERNLLELTFAAVVLTIVGVIVARWVKHRPGWREIGVGLGVALAYLTMFLRMESPEERTHLIEYGIVAALIHQALLERARNRPVPVPAALAIGLTAVLGLLDEIIQAAMPNRAFDVRDVFFNALAGFMVVAARLAIVPQTRPGWRVWFLWMLGTAFAFGWGVYWGSFADPSDPSFLDPVPTMIGAAYLGLVVGGALAGVLQWVVIRAHLDGAGRWVLASVAAVGLVGGIMLALNAIDPRTSWLVGAGGFGAITGACQWVILRGQVGRAGWWILASGVAWLGALPAGDEVGPLGLGAVYGVVTGTFMVWLLRPRTHGAHVHRL